MNDDNLIKLFIFLIGFINIGMATGLALLLDDQATVKSQLLDIAMYILIIVFINFIVLTAFCGDKDG